MTTVIDVLREPCQCCGLPVPLADLMFCRCGCGLVCADKEVCGGRIERRIAWLKATSAKFRALCALVQGDRGWRRGNREAVLMTIDPALNVPCPTCRVGAGQPCRSRRAISLHQGRRQALAELGVQADRVLAADSRKPAPGKPERRTVFVGRTGEGNVIPETAEFWPPWEDPPVPGCLAESGIPVSGLVWCPVHREYEELRDGVPAVRLGGGG